jgi:hypothetical protein
VNRSGSLPYKSNEPVLFSFVNVLSLSSSHLPLVLSSNPNGTGDLKERR